MSANNPPNPYFTNINFNSSFFSAISNYLTLAYANAHYLLSYGTATSTATTTQFSGSVGIGATASGTAGDLQITSGTVSNNLYVNGKVGIGTTSNPTATTSLNIYSSTQNSARVALTGTEFYQGTNTSTDGIAQVLGVNRSGNRQLFIADTALLTQNTTNPMIKIAISSTPTISAIATDNSTSLNLGLGTNLTLYANGVAQLGAQSKNTNIITAGSFDINSAVYINTIPTYDPSTAVSGYGQQLTLSGTGTGTWGQLYIMDRVATGTNYTGILVKADNANSVATMSSFRQGGTTSIPLVFNLINNNPVGIGTIPGSGYKLDVNGTLRAFTNSTSGFATLAPADSLHNGYCEFFTPAQLRAGYIGYNTTINSTNYLVLACENSYVGLNIQQNLVVNGNITTTSGNIVCSSVTIAPAFLGASGYWQIDITKFVTGNYFPLLTINACWIAQSYFWNGRITINLNTLTILLNIDQSYNLGLVSTLFGSTGSWFIRLAPSSGTLTSSDLLSYKIIG